MSAAVVDERERAPDTRSWVPEVGLGAVLVVVAFLDLDLTDLGKDGWWPLVVAVGFVVASVLARRAPAAALAIVWFVGVLQVVTDTPLMVVELGIAVVSFGNARWGSPVTLALSALSIPAAAVAGVLAVSQGFYFPFDDDGGNFATLVEVGYRFGDTWVVAVSAVGVLVLGGPWLAGLAMRFAVRAQVSRVSQASAEAEAARAVRETAQAQEIAQLRDGQARLARDVHDVVGHSLAVILAQAESAQYLPDADPERLKATMATIASSARSSLQDVRQVLQSGQEQDAVTPPGALDTLVDGVRASGHEVVSRELGTAQPMPPELEVVAYRVLQEMLTNAIKHGRRDEPIFVERHWPDGSWAGELRLEVRNTVSAPAPARPHGTGVHDETQPLRALPPDSSVPPAPDGSGLEGMRRRLESVGGRLDVRRREEDDAVTFTTTAWVPVRTVSP